MYINYARDARLERDYNGHYYRAVINVGNKSIVAHTKSTSLGNIKSLCVFNASMDLVYLCRSVIIQRVSPPLARFDGSTSFASKSLGKTSWVCFFMGFFPALLPFGVGFGAAATAPG